MLQRMSKEYEIMNTIKKERKNAKIFKMAKINENKSITGQKPSSLIEFQQLIQTTFYKTYKQSRGVKNL